MIDFFRFDLPKEYHSGEHASAIYSLNSVDNIFTVGPIKTKKVVLITRYRKFKVLEMNVGTHINIFLAGNIAPHDIDNLKAHNLHLTF